MTDLLVRAVVVGDPTGGWARVLAQEGIPLSVTNTAVPLDRGAVVFTQSSLPDWVADHVEAGGVAVLSDARQLPGQAEPGARAAITRFRVPGTDRTATAPTMVTIPAGQPVGLGAFHLHEDRIPKFGSDPDVFPVVATTPFGAGWVVASPIPLTELVVAQGDGLRAFCEFTAVTERVSAIDKADVVDTLLVMTELGFRRAGLPLVTLSRFPGGTPSVLILRVDVDGAFGERTQWLVDAAQAAGLPSSFYVNADLCRRHPGLPASWPADVEVGQHGFAHTLFDSDEENLENLRSGERWVQENVDRTVRSFVAPRGLWNASLGRSLQAMGYRYSSDFGLDFDSLPFRDSTGHLQVPVHPYSPERARRWAKESGVVAPTAEETADYYVAVVRRQTALRRPAHVYGHPEALGPMAGVVVPRLADAARELGIGALSLGDYADFWLRREQVRLRSVLTSDGTLEVTGIQDPELTVTVHSGRVRRLVLHGRTVVVPTGDEVPITVADRTSDVLGTSGPGVRSSERTPV